MITDLQCEYATNPLGIDILQPQFSWRLEGEKPGMHQLAYRIFVSDTPKGFGNKTKIIWDSGKIYSGTSTGIQYEGPEPESRKNYYWMVNVWMVGKPGVYRSNAAHFEMGLLKPEDWQACWIGSPANWPGRALYFRRRFVISGKVKKARAYISGLGYYELYLNGTKAGNQVLDPGTSDYSKRILYVTHDITSYLNLDNVIAVIVGPGWYGIPKLRLQAEITYEDGRSEIIATNWDPDKNWLVGTGPIRESSIFNGELYDARKERNGWTLPEYNTEFPVRTESWINAVITDSPGGKMVAQIQEPIFIVETIIPKLIYQPNKGIYVYDAGKNLAGWAAIKVEGKTGTKINLKFAETLRQDGSVNQDNLRSAAAQDTYILKGDSVEKWEPAFTYHGFRYIQVEGFPYMPDTDDIQVKVVRSAVKQTGSFECSNHLLNRIHEMVFQTEASNLHSIPTDCPQRDERMGWLNDMTVRIEQALYNFNLSRFYSKWISDIKDTQHPDGTITDTAPFRWGFRPADPVSVSYLLLAYKSYEFYGNIKIVRDHYEGLKAWVDFLYSLSENGILNYSNWGDWAPPEEFGVAESVGSGAVSKFTPGALISTGFLFYSARLIAQLSSKLGNNVNKTHYTRLSEKVATAFNRTWWNEKQGGYGSNNQACNSFALYMGLVSEERKPRVLKNLVDDVKNHNYHLTTGNLCTKYLLETLTENGYAEIAYKIVTRETYPGWGYMLANGATTLWERWENKTGDEMNSHNHPMMGSVDTWFYKYLAGISPDFSFPGFERFIIKPYIIDELTFVKGEYNSVKGCIVSSWTKSPNALSLQVSVPCNSTAVVYVPSKNTSNITESGREISSINLIKLGEEENYSIFEVRSGEYHFKTEW